MKYEVSRLVDDFHLPSIVYMFVSCAILVHVHIDRSVAPRMLLASLAYLHKLSTHEPPSALFSISSSLSMPKPMNRLPPRHTPTRRHLPSSRSHPPRLCPSQRITLLDHLSLPSETISAHTLPRHSPELD